MPAATNAPQDYLDPIKEPNRQRQRSEAQILSAGKPRDYTKALTEKGDRLWKTIERFRR